MSYKNSIATPATDEDDEKEESKTPSYPTAQIQVNNELVTITANIPLLPSPSPGRPPDTLTQEEEKGFAGWLVNRSDSHLPVGRKHANQKAVMLLERTGETPKRRFRSKDGLPSDHWWLGFYHRWPQCATRTYQLISRGKATLQQHDLDVFYTELGVLQKTIPAEVSTHTQTFIIH